MKRQIWQLIIISMTLLTAITFTPLILPPSEYSPELAGLPYSFWMGFLITCLMIFITYLGTRYHPSNREKNGEND